MKVITASTTKLIIVKTIISLGNEWDNILTHTVGKAVSLNFL